MCALVETMRSSGVPPASWANDTNPAVSRRLNRGFGRVWPGRRGADIKVIVATATSALKRLEF